MDRTIPVNSDDKSTGAPEANGRARLSPARRVLFALSLLTSMGLLATFVMVCQEAVRLGEEFRAEHLAPSTPAQPADSATLSRL